MTIFLFRLNDSRAPITSTGVANKEPKDLHMALRRRVHKTPQVND